MIRTVADLLHQLMEQGTADIDASGVVHRPTIGEMYEGLTHDLLGRAIPHGANLRLVSGFATDGLGNRSGQLDCMLVRGKGTRLPYTDKYVWHVRDVIAVFEVKKTITKPILEDAFQHLAGIAELERSHWQSVQGSVESVDPTPISRTFAQVTQRLPNLEDVDSMSFEHQIVWDVLLSEYEGAVRVVLGYNGWGTEASFRSALVGILEDHLGEPGYGVRSFPQLITAGAHSLVKANGQPFTIPLVDDGWWPFYFSTSVNPLLLVLELVWTRLDILYGLKDAWGDDLEVERPTPFLLAQAEERGDEIGWNYRIVRADPDAVDPEPPFDPWTPSVVTEEQFMVLQRLAAGGRIRFDDPQLLKFLAEQDIAISEFWDTLLATSLVARSADDTEIVLITRECVLVIDPELGCIAAENGSGQFYRWMQRRLSAKAPRDDQA